MRRLAVAVLLFLFVISIALPGSYSQNVVLADSGGPQPSALWSLDSDHSSDFSQTFIVEGEPLKHLVADLNNDGYLDIAVIYVSSSRVDVFFSDDHGRFIYDNRTTITMPGPVTDIAAGDVNKDSLTDLAVSCNVTGSDLFVLSQANGFNRSAPYLEIASTSKPRAVLLHDFDGDTWLDIATLFHADILSYQPGFEVLLKSLEYDSTGTISLYQPSLGMQQPSLFVQGDFSLDGKSDLVIGDRSTGKVVGFINGANGLDWNSMTNVVLVGQPSAMILQQLDGTGPMELIVAEETSSKVKIWRYETGSFIFQTDVEEQGSISSMTVLDVNDDSRLDLVSTSILGNNLTVFRASASILYGHSDSIVIPTPYRPVRATPGNMDKDLNGMLDLVVSSRSSPGFGAISIYYAMEGTVSNADVNRIIKDLSPTSMVTGDFNHDGSEEIAAYDTSGPYLSFLDETSSSPDRLDAPNGVLALECRDLDGDGFEDIVMMSATNATVWFGSQDIFSGPSRQVTVQSALTALHSVLLEDLNNDGEVDLAVGGSGGVDIFWNSGTGTLFATAQHYMLTLPGASVASLAAVAVQGTVHNDARNDLAIINSTSSRLELYYQQSTGGAFITSSYSYLNIIPGAFQLLAGDLNDDGLGDLSVLTPSEVRVYLQNGSYSRGFSDSQPVLSIEVGEKPISACLGDLDDDGGLDLAMITQNSTVMAYRCDGPAFTLLARQTSGASPGSLSVGDMNGDSKSDLVACSAGSHAFSFYHQVNMAPVAVGTEEGTGHLEGDTVWFNASGSADSFSDIDHLTYSWDFGDGNSAIGFRVNNTFDDDGTYTVTLNVSDPSEASGVFTFNVTLGDRSPIANFSFSGELVEGGPIVFTDLSTSPADDIRYWNWSFGDGEWSNQTSNAPVQHAYAWNDTFIVTLTVIDEDDSSNFTSRTIIVEDSAPVADFSVSTSTPVEGQAMTFTDQSDVTADGIENWYWDLGDGTHMNRSSAAPFEHTYAYNGTYQVTLVVRDIDGSEDSFTRTIVVQDSAPVAKFLVSLTSPSEGEEISFTDNSSAPYNDIVSWSWDLDDGTVFNGKGPVVHTYVDNGTYYVTLTVTDVDGNVNTTTMTVVVKDTSPAISRLYTVGGATTFKEYDWVTLEVVATAQWDDALRFQWDFQTVVFQADLETDVNTTSHRYNSSGTYRITVRVWDIDSYSDIYIQITITDPAPVPDFTFAANNVNRTVSFSAALTRDTENEVLEYRWFFGDNQQTGWSGDQSVNHSYTRDGIYSVRLEVRDGNNPTVMKTRNVTIDLLPPVISMDDPVLKAIVGESTLIKVNVTDLVGIGSVILEYTIGNVTRTVVMTHEGGGIYFAQIPSQNRTMELTYRIIAEDMAGHSASTEEFTLVLEYEDPSLFIYSSLALLIAFLAIIIYLFLSRPIVDEVFVLYHDGTLLAHQTRRLKPGMDDDILGGMLIALQNFVRDSFKDENSTVLRRMDFGERKLLVERKDDFFMAVMLSGKRAGNAAQRMVKVLDNIEGVYAPVLKDWDGDLEKVRGIRDETKPLFSRANPLDRLKRKEGGDDSI